VTALVVPPRPPATRGRRLVAPGLTIGGLALATLALHLRDPHEQGSWGFCPFQALTGLYCPGCGGLRAVNDLTDGHVGAALSSNLVVTLAIPLAVAALGIWTLDRWAGRTRQVPWSRWQRGTVVLVAALAVFTVVRNLAFGAWLAP
jgi:uncharacterized protein DUF2752